MSDIKFSEQNSTNFPISSKNKLLQISKSLFKKEDILKYHQFIVYNYLINSNNRGLLLFHEMGMGKSITAVALAEYYREHVPDKKIIVLLAKSLQANFQNNIEKYIKLKKKDSDENIDEVIKNNYKFISLNASNMYSQISRVNKTNAEIETDKQLKEFTDIVEKDDFLENSILIIDEFHNFSNSVTNGSYNAIRLYDIIMRTKNIKLLFLSGTPIINSPFELVPTFNMLKGFIYTDDKTKTTLFPELEKDFNLYFVDYKDNKIKNDKKFQNRIFGMCSYYGNLYFDNATKNDFPEEYPIKIELVPMSSEQFSRYNMYRDFEREESSVKGMPSKAERFSDKSLAAKSYRVQSRQVSNYLIPEYALGPARGKKSRAKFIDKIKPADLKNLSVFSPKIKQILKNIDKHKNQLGLIYSEFVTGEGIGILSKVLDVHGYDCWNTFNKIKDDSDVFDIPTKKSENKKYAVITGDVSFDERSKIIKTFNDPKNKTGDKITLLLISKTGAEGLDLKNVRHVHLMEPYWNYARLSQIIARAVRYKSHEDLGPKFKNVQPYIYLSDYPADFNIKKKKEKTTDLDLYGSSIKHLKLINDFYIALAESSIDCNVHSSSFSKNIQKKIKCKLCSPSGKELYHPILSKQMLLPDPCEELKKEKITVKSISIPGHDAKFYYSKDSKKQFHIYQYDNKIDGYTIMQSDNPIYSDIIKKLLKY
jgi:superfamily II DNA or RNA helicase